MLSFKTLVDFINRNDYINLKNFLENRHCNVDDTDEDKNLTALMVAASQGKGPFKYYFIKEVGGWGQKVAIFDDLQYSKSSKRW